LGSITLTQQRCAKTQILTSSEGLIYGKTEQKEDFFLPVWLRMEAKVSNLSQLLKQWLGLQRRTVLSRANQHS